MSERTALILAGLSHQGLLPLLVVTAGCGALYAVTRKRPNRAARAFTGILFVASLLLFAVAFFHVGCATISAHRVQCSSNVKSLSMALLTYARDNDDTFPAADVWANAVKPGEEGESLRCPASESPYGYGMNSALGGMMQLKVERQAETVLLFDSRTSAQSYAGGVGDVARERHGGSPNLGFADGHMKSIGMARVDKWLWNPVAAK